MRDRPAAGKRDFDAESGVGLRLPYMRARGNHLNRLTAERLAHILGHPEMASMATELGRVLLKPQLVRRSRSDGTVRLFYEFYAQTVLGGKWLCVVVQYGVKDAFVVTAYLTEQPNVGEDLWPIE